MKNFKKFLIPGVICFVFFFSYSLFAKDLNRRMGVGYINQFEARREMPSISVKYGLSKEFQILGALGVSSITPTQFGFGAKIFKNIFYESNLNFYTALGFGFSREVASTCDILALMGAEFFIPGVDSLGLSFEFGGSLNNGTGTFTFKTVGYTFLNAGIHFYF